MTQREAPADIDAEEQVLIMRNKLCKCGCGQSTPLAKRNRGLEGHTKGQGIDFIRGHNSRINQPTPVEAFWGKVTKGANSDCWIWSGSKGSHGYGQLSVGRHPTLAHRFAYKLLIGPISQGMTIDHLCRNRPCVNPAHMEVVDKRTNILRGNGAPAQNARKTHCAKGHLFDRIESAGYRRCLTCKRQQARQRYALRKTS